MDTSLFDSFLLLFVTSTKYMHRLMKNAVESSGLNPTGFICLLLMSSSSGGMSAGEISKISCFDKALISRLLKDLEKNGYIQKNSEDIHLSRGYRMMLTDKGNELADRLRKGMQYFYKAVTEDIPQEELKVYYDTSLKISENMRKLVNDLKL